MQKHGENECLGLNAVYHLQKVASDLALRYNEYPNGPLPINYGIHRPLQLSADRFVLLFVLIGYRFVFQMPERASIANDLLVVDSHSYCR